jgi:hypothetical protein
MPDEYDMTWYFYIGVYICLFNNADRGSIYSVQSTVRTIR